MSMSNGLANDIAYLVNDEDTLYDVRLRGDEWLNDVWFKGFYPTDMNHIFREEIFYKLQNEDNCPIKVHFKMRKSGKRVTIPVSDIWTISKSSESSDDNWKIKPTVLKMLIQLKQYRLYDYVRSDRTEPCQNVKFLRFEPMELNNCRDEVELMHKILDNPSSVSLVMGFPDGFLSYVFVEQIASIKESNEKDIQEDDTMSRMKEHLIDVANKIFKLKVGKHYNLILDEDKDMVHYVKFTGCSYTASCEEIRDLILDEMDDNIVFTFEKPNDYTFALHAKDIFDITETGDGKIQLLTDDKDRPYRWKPDFRKTIGVEDYPWCMLRIDDILYPAIHLRWDAELTAHIFGYIHDGNVLSYVVTKDKIWDQDCYIINYHTLKEVPRTSLVELGRRWNYDALKIGRPYRLVKDGKEHFALLSQITGTCLVFVTAERDSSKMNNCFGKDHNYPDNCYVEILVNPGIQSTDYDVYPME